MNNKQIPFLVIVFFLAIVWLGKTVVVYADDPVSALTPTPDPTTPTTPVSTDPTTPTPSAPAPTAPVTPATPAPVTPAAPVVAPTPVTPTSDSFVMAMKTKTGNSQILSCSASAYDAVHIIANIINKVGTDGTAIKNELLATDYTQGVSAPEIKFDQNGIMTNANYVVQVVKNGISQEKK